MKKLPAGYITLFDYCVKNQLDIVRMTALWHYRRIKLLLVGGENCGRVDLDDPGVLCIKKDTPPPLWAQKSQSRWITISVEAEGEWIRQNPEPVAAPAIFTTNDIAKAVGISYFKALCYIKDLYPVETKEQRIRRRPFSRDEYKAAITHILIREAERKAERKTERIRGKNHQYSLARLTAEVRASHQRVKEMLATMPGFTYEPGKLFTREQYELMLEHCKAAKANIQRRAPGEAIINGVKCVTFDLYAEANNVKRRKVRDLLDRGKLPQAFIVKPEAAVRSTYYIPADTPFPGV